MSITQNFTPAGGLTFYRLRPQQPAGLFTEGSFKMKTIAILKQGNFWSAYFKGFEFDNFVAPTPFSVNMPATEVIKKLAAFPANKDVARIYEYYV